MRESRTSRTWIPEESIIGGIHRAISGHRVSREPLPIPLANIFAGDAHIRAAGRERGPKRKSRISERERERERESAIRRSHHGAAGRKGAMAAEERCEIFSYERRKRHVCYSKYTRGTALPVRPLADLQKGRRQAFPGGLPTRALLISFARLSREYPMAAFLFFSLLCPPLFHLSSWAFHLSLCVPGSRSNHRLTD